MSLSQYHMFQISVKNRLYERRSNNYSVILGCRSFRTKSHFVPNWKSFRTNYQKVVSYQKSQFVPIGTKRLGTSSYQKVKLVRNDQYWWIHSHQNKVGTKQPIAKRGFIQTKITSCICLQKFVNHLILEKCNIWRVWKSSRGFHNLLWKVLQSRDFE